MRRSSHRKVDRNGSCHTDAKSMESMKIQFRPISPHRSNLFSRNPKNSSSVTKLNFFIAASIAISVVLFCYAIVVLSGYRSSVKKKFGIVIDGGSTGTRIHVFEYLVGNGVQKFDFGKEGLASMRVNPGLSSYAEDTDGAGESLKELVEFGKKRVPKEFWADTEVRLMATAGMRLLDSGVQERILGSCRKFLRLSGFKFRDDWASVITGSEEGAYAWIVANYALGTLGGDPQETTGIIELGGASAQVTFVSSEPIPTEFSHVVKIGNRTYNLYSHSLLQLGQNVAFDLLRASLVTSSPESGTESREGGKSLDPCTPYGYSHDIKSSTLAHSLIAEKSKYLSSLQPKGNFSECRSAALTFLQKGKDKCSFRRCDIGSTFIPKLEGKFLATENFFHTSKFFGVPPKAFISGLMRAGQQFCEDDWSKLRVKYQSFEEDDLQRYCFSSAYIVALLHDSLGIAVDDERIGYANQVGDIPLDWALGAFISQNTADTESEHPKWFLTIGISNDSSTLIALCAIAVVLMFSAWSFSKWRKPQVKTIYDLEKGKYIVTRVNRYS